MANLMSTATSVINAAGKISNILFDLSPKTFYSTRDFYNFIKKRLNAPMARKHFTIVPRCLIHTDGNDIPQVWNSIFNDSNLAKFAILAQQLSFPGQTFGMQGNQAQPIVTPYGQYSPQANGYSGGTGNTIKIDFLLTAKPVILHIILPWYYLCLRTTNKIQSRQINNDKEIIVSYSEYPCPKLTLDIKYYRMDLISGLLFLMNPTFVYRITGVYPISITPALAKHQGPDSGTLTRGVTFKYNNFICIPDGAYLLQMYGNTRKGFAYKNMSPIQILNALNLTAQGVIGAADAVRNIF